MKKDCPLTVLEAPYSVEEVPSQKMENSERRDMAKLRECPGSPPVVNKRTFGNLRIDLVLSAAISNLK